MSDVYRGRDEAPGDDWWQAGDDKWYHPGLHPERQASATVPPAEGWWRGVDDAWYPPELHPDAQTAPVIGERGDIPAVSDSGVPPEDELFADMMTPLADERTETLEVVSRAGSEELVDSLPFVDISDESPPAAANAPAPPAESDLADATETAAKIDETPVQAPYEIIAGIDPVTNPSPALSMPVPPMPSSVTMASNADVEDSTEMVAEMGATAVPSSLQPPQSVETGAISDHIGEIPLPQVPSMPDSPDPTRMNAALPSADAVPTPPTGQTLSPTLTPADIAGPIFPTPTAAPVAPVGSGERMVLPSPSEVVGQASAPVAGAPIHLPGPTISDARHDLPAPSASPTTPSHMGSGPDLAPPPPVFSPDAVVSPEPEYASDGDLAMDGFAPSESDHSMERLDETRASKRRFAMLIGGAVLLAFLGFFIFNRISGGGTDVVTPEVSTAGATDAAVNVVGGDGAAAEPAAPAAGDPAEELSRLRSTGIQGDDAAVTAFAKEICAEVDKGSSWAEVLSYAASSDLAITDPGMVAKVIASTCPAANGG